MVAEKYSKILHAYPPLPNESLQDSITALLRENNLRIVVLDDDPTGIQTVHGNYLLTNWKAENIAAAMADGMPCFYVLTNTRAMTADAADRTVREAMHAILDINEKFGYKIIFISRSDSTLRGHFPLEIKAMRDEILRRGIPVPLPTVFTPAFFEAGRYTLDGVQVMREGDRLIPVAETEFARDNVFGYHHSELSKYIAEKSPAGEISTENIRHFSLNELRDLSEEALERAIFESAGKRYITLDALDYSDLRKFSYAFLNVFIRTGGYAVLRTSSSLPKAMSGIADQALLDARSLGGTTAGGLFVIGSHVQKTTAQLARLLELTNTEGVEIDIRRALGDPEKLLRETEEKLLAIHRNGRIPVVYTSRQEFRSDHATERQQLGQRISDFLVEIVKNLSFTPGWLVAKGGITSHDILTRGLGIERARVLGQVLPGVPAVITGAENRWPSMPYIIFPGNVGSEDGLAGIAARLSGKKDWKIG